MPGHAPGFSFALHLLRVQGFYFALLQCSPIQAFTARFVPSMQLYHTRRKTAHRALQGLFQLFVPFYRRKYQTDTSGYNTACATLERITAPQHLQRIPDTTATPDGCTGQHSHPIIIRYIKKQRRAPVMDPCQTVQHIADHASPAGSVPTVCGSLASAAPGGAVQQQAGGAEQLAATAVALFGLSPDS